MTRRGFTPLPYILRCALRTRVVWFICLLRTVWLDPCVHAVYARYHSSPVILPLYYSRTLLRVTCLAGPFFALVVTFCTVGCRTVVYTILPRLLVLHTFSYTLRHGFLCTAAHCCTKFLRSAHRTAPHHCAVVGTAHRAGYVQNDVVALHIVVPHTATLTVYAQRVGGCTAHFNAVDALRVFVDTASCTAPHTGADHHRLCRFISTQFCGWMTTTHAAFTVTAHADSVRDCERSVTQRLRFMPLHRSVFSSFHYTVCRFAHRPIFHLPPHARSRFAPGTGPGCLAPHHCTTTIMRFSRAHA